MVKIFGYDTPRFHTAIDSQVRIADLIAESEEDFLLWARTELFKKMPKTQGSLSMIDGKLVLIVRPRSGIRRAVFVKTAQFLNGVHEYVSIVGSSHEKAYGGG